MPERKQKLELTGISKKKRARLALRILLGDEVKLYHMRRWVSDSDIQISSFVCTEATI